MFVSNRRVRLMSWLWLFACLGGAAAVPAGAQLAQEQQQQLLQEATEALRQAALAFREEKFSEAGEQLSVAMDRSRRALADAEAATIQPHAGLLDRIGRAHALLELEGVRLPPWRRPGGSVTAGGAAPADPSEPSASADGNRSMAADRGTESTAGKEAAASEAPASPAARTASPRSRRPRPTRQPPEEAVSFRAEVAPLLLAHCGRCHVQETRGNFNMASYVQLMAGPPEGVVLFPGDPDSSRLVETIETGDMPRGGGTVPAEQLELLKRWIAEGARFDGPDPRLPMAAYARPAAATSSPDASAAAPAEAAAPSGEETVSFAKQIAPILMQNCNGCHVEATQVRGGLRLDTIAQLMRGGDSGPIVRPGDAAGSLLVRKLRGEEGDRMPAGGRPPLSEEQIALISTWIAEGATIDADFAPLPLPRMASLAWSRDATHEELATRRQEMAAANWKLGGTATARDQYSETENDDFYVLGSTGPQTLRVVAQAAQSALRPVRTLVPAADKSVPYFRGRITVLVFPRRYDYGEFAKMVERREVPSSWRAHWRFDGVDAYVAIVVPSDEPESSVRARLLSPLASLAVAQQGTAPRWFQEGFGRAAAVQLGGRDLQPQAAEWDSQLAGAVAAVEKVEQIVQEQLPPEQTDLIGYGAAKSMFDRANRRSLTQLLAAMGEGTAFDEAFSASFRATPAEYLSNWLRWYSANETRSRRR